MKFLKTILLRSFRTSDGFGKKKKDDIRRKPSWVVPVSHGYSVLENEASKSGLGDSDECNSGSIIVQREQIQESETWFFGAFETPIGDKISKYIQPRLFNGKLNESQVRRKSKETMRKAYVNARAKMRDSQNEEKWTIGSASALVIGGVKLVMAHMGGYRAVLCQDGIAKQINSKHQLASKRHWSRKLFSVRILARDLSRTAGAKQTRSSELLVGSHKIDSASEFVILACSGVWEVMNSQEAVDLIRHFEDPQEAAECLAKEAVARMSKSNITCLVIRFD